MRIAMVSEHANPLAVLGGVDAGGQNVHVAELARALGARGHDVVVHTRRDDPGQPDYVQLAPGVRVHHVTAGPPEPIGKDDLLEHVPELARGLRRAWRQETPEVVHAHYWMSGLAAIDAAADLRLPVALTFHALGSVKRRYYGDADTSPASRVDSELHLARRVDRVIATSPHEVDELVAMGASPNRIEVIPCGIDLAQFRPRGERLARAGTRPLLLSIGRLVPRKGVDDAIRMLTWLPDCELVVAGGPAADHLDADAEVQRLRQLACESGVSERVTFLGAVGRADVPTLMRSADMVVCLPWYEPFGIVPVEAMACGTSVLGVRVGGLLDTVEDGGTGLLVAPRDPHAAALAARRMLAAPGLLRAMRERGPVRAAEQFSSQSVARRTESAYLDLVTGMTEPGAARVPQARSADRTVGVRG